MPVMIRNNDATELCITKGQEGFVIGWQAEKGSHGKRVLDTLFVKLDKPAKTIQIPGLPENVVPLVKGTKTIKCIFPSDLKEDIERQQVHVLPNFAMTDYASQGKNRPKNVAHLSSCFTHMSTILAYHVALLLLALLLCKVLILVLLLEDVLDILDKNSENMKFLMILLDLDMKVFCLVILKAQLEIQLLDSISNGKVNIIFQIKLIYHCIGHLMIYWKCWL